MTLFHFIQQCLRREAARTEPDCRSLLEHILQTTQKDPPHDPKKTKDKL